MAGLSPGIRAKWIPRLYLLNFALLAAHEVDSAFWREWELFRLPGGSQLFTLLHVPLFAALLAGYGAVLRGGRFARTWALTTAAVGPAAFAIHTAFLLAGRPQFRLPVSLGLIWAMLAASLVQAALAARFDSPKGQ